MICMPARWDAAGDRCECACWSRMIFPSSGAYTPARILISVLLPHPFSPARQWISAGRMVKSRLLSARTPPKRLLIPSISMNARAASGCPCSARSSGTIIAGPSPSKAQRNKLIYRVFIDRLILDHFDDSGLRVHRGLAEPFNLRTISDWRSVNYHFRYIHDCFTGLLRVPNEALKDHAFFDEFLPLRRHASSH